MRLHNPIIQYISHLHFTISACKMKDGVMGVELMVQYTSLAGLPFLPAPGLITNLVFSTLICNALLAELTKRSLIYSYLLY
jgi:hypothetical protein